MASDEQLIAAANAGDAAAFAALYERYREFVIAVAFRCSGDRDVALDAMQETFAYWLRKFPGFELRGKVTTFLYPVARSTAVEIVRRRRLARAGADESASQAVAPERASGGANAEMLAQLRAALGQLPAGQREVLLLRFGEDMQLGEIAEALGIPVGTVKSRLSLGLAGLRDWGLGIGD